MNIDSAAGALLLLRLDESQRHKSVARGDSSKTPSPCNSLVPEYKAGVFRVGLASLRDPALVTVTLKRAAAG